MGTKNMRIKFKKGEQRKFIEEVLKKLNSPSVRELSSRLYFNYSSLKNYYSECRLIPEIFFENLCLISGINKDKLKFEIIEDNWGQIKGGKK